MPVLSSYVRDHAALPRMSANADFSTPLKCLASGKSIEQRAPANFSTKPALHCFRILLVYPCALYYGMLILSRAYGACPWLCLLPKNRVYKNQRAKHSECQNASEPSITVCTFSFPQTLHF